MTISIGKKVPNTGKMKEITLIGDRYRNHLQNDLFYIKNLEHYSNNGKHQELHNYLQNI